MLGTTQAFSDHSRVLLLLAHPGHEVFVHGWLERLRPLVLVLTDGSDSRYASPLQTTLRNVQTAQGRVGSLFGRFTDRGLNQSLLMKDHERFIALAEEIADILLSEKIDWVIGGAGESQVPGADLCRMLLDTASGLVSRRLIHLRNYEFSLRTTSTLSPRGSHSRQIEIDLEEPAWQRKRRAMLNLPGLGHLLQHPPEEVNRWKRETLQLTQPWQLLRLAEETDLEYPLPHPVKFREHLLALGEALRLTAACGRAVA
jgi:hypothetical protein